MAKTILITGATSGIGRALALTAHQAGHRIIACGRRKERLQELQSILQEKDKLAIYDFDIQVKEEVETFWEALKQGPADFQKVDVLVNNAGLSRGLNPIQSGLWSDWQEMIQTNITGLLSLTRLVGEDMVSRKAGQIINVSSIAGKEAYPGGNVYMATKSAVEALTKGMRIDLAPHGIRVASIAPGMAETEFSIVRFHGDESKAKAVYQGLEALTPEDIADVIMTIINAPAHVNIADVLLLPTAQASANHVFRGTTN